MQTLSVMPVREVTHLRPAPIAGRGMTRASLAFRATERACSAGAAEQTAALA